MRRRLVLLSELHSQHRGRDAFRELIRLTVKIDILEEYGIHAPRSSRRDDGQDGPATKEGGMSRLHCSALHSGICLGP